MTPLYPLILAAYPLVLAAALWAQGSEPAALPSAFDLLEAVRDSYSSLASYADAGHIELVALEIDDPVLPLMAPTATPNRDVPVVVASTAGAQRFGK